MIVVVLTADGIGHKGRRTYPGRAAAREFKTGSRGELVRKLPNCYFMGSQAMWLVVVGDGYEMRACDARYRVVSPLEQLAECLDAPRT